MTAETDNAESYIYKEYFEFLHWLNGSDRKVFFMTTIILIYNSNSSYILMCQKSFAETRYSFLDYQKVSSRTGYWVGESISLVGLFTSMLYSIDLLLRKVL